MSKKNRYQFAKSIYKDYIILIKYRNNYITYDNDNLICHYIGFYKNKKIKIFHKFKINYLILDELDIIKKITFDTNKYEKYSYLANLTIVIKKIKNKLISNNKLFDVQN